LVRRNIELEALLVAKYAGISGVLDERARRLWAATEARAIGYGGDSVVSAATGLARETIRNGRRELLAGLPLEGRIRRPGAGRPGIEARQPGLGEALEKLVSPITRGDPMSPLRWTCKSKAKLAAAMVKAGWQVSATTVGLLLRSLGYSLRSVRKSTEGESHPDRNAQFENISATAAAFMERGSPVISVDTKKKELVGDFKNAGREWQPAGNPEQVLTHEFPSDAAGKAVPYGIYDMSRNEAFVNVGKSHDTPAFAVASIRRWWSAMGRKSYSKARELLITADAGGSNGYRSRVWKAELQRFADETGLCVRVAHFPPGTSKWNKIEHRVFCHITQNWRGKPLRTFETVVECIGHTRTAEGLRVRARLDKRDYPTGARITRAEMKALQLELDEFHGDWNYEIRPRTKLAD
jgi:Rhodopirellula transposase DDE domain